MNQWLSRELQRPGVKIKAAANGKSGKRLALRQWRPRNLCEKPLAGGWLKRRLYIVHLTPQVTIDTEAHGDCQFLAVLLRPVVVLSDQEHENERRFEPPPLIHSSVWGPEVYIVHLNNNHYEATCPLAKPRTKQEHVKREPGNR